MSTCYQCTDSFLFNIYRTETDSVKLFKLLDSVATKAKREANDELYWKTEVIRIEYYTYNWIYSYQKSIEELQKIIPKVRAYPALVLKISYISGMHYYHNDEFVKAFELVIKYAHLLEGLPDSKYDDKKGYLSLLGDLYYAFEDYKGAKEYLTKASKLPLSKARQVDNGIYNTLGLVMRNTSNYDSALYYFNKVLGMTISDTDPWVAIANGNIGIIYYLQKKYSLAKPLLRADIERALAAKEYDNIANQLTKLADIYRLSQQYDSANHYASIAREYTTIGRDKYKHLVGLYALLGKLAVQKGNSVAALKYKDSVILAKDSVAIKRSILLMSRAQIKVARERHKSEVARIVAIKEMSIQKRNNIIIFLSLFAVIGILLIYIQSSRRKKLKAEKELADNKLQSAQHRLSVFTKSLSEKNQLIENFTQEIERLQALPCSNELPDTKENLAKLQNSIILTDEQWSDFKELFDQVHEGYLYRLKEKLPELTAAETRYMALCKLKLSNKEMANMLGIGLSGMRNYKYRLNKKINISDDESFDELVESI